MPRSETEHRVQRPAIVQRPVVSLHAYPLKGARAVDVDRLVVGRQGAVGDRIWMVVDADGRFVSQRNEPMLARIAATHGEHGGLNMAWDPLSAANPAWPTLSVPPAAAYEREVDVFGRPVLGVDAGDEAAEWLSGSLGRRVRLLSSQAAPGRYVDAEPLLVTTTASLEDLGTGLPMDRFRPNIVVETAEPWEEDTWTHIEVRCDGATSTVRLRVVKPCLRCSVPSRDQRTGTVSKEPLAALARKRRVERGVERGVAFGIYVKLDVQEARDAPHVEAEPRITVIKG